MHQSKYRIHRLGLKENQYTQYYYIETFSQSIEKSLYSLDEKIPQRLKYKEKLMIKAIENNVLEKIVTTEENIKKFQKFTIIKNYDTI